MTERRVHPGRLEYYQSGDPVSDSGPKGRVHPGRLEYYQSSKLAHYQPGDPVVVRESNFGPKGRVRPGMKGVIVESLAPKLKKRGSIVTSAYYRVYIPELDKEYSLKGNFLNPDPELEGEGLMFKGGGAYAHKSSRTADTWKV